MLKELTVGLGGGDARGVGLGGRYWDLGWNLFLQ